MTRASLSDKETNNFRPKVHQKTLGEIIINHATECPKNYRKSVLHLVKYTTNLYLSRCCTDMR